MAGIYIHIPFCKSKCYYCDFYSCTLLAKKQELLTAVGDELDRRADFLQGETIETIYIGGGTPSLCTPSEIGTLLEKIFRRYPRVSLKEITVEANPDDLTFDYLRDLHATGVNRLSIGVQSFIDRDLRWMHRRPGLVMLPGCHPGHRQRPHRRLRQPDDRSDLRHSTNES